MARPSLPQFVSFLALLQLISPKQAQSSTYDRHIRLRRIRRIRMMMRKMQRAQAMENRRRRITAMTCLMLLYSSSRIVDIDAEKMPQYTTWFDESVMNHYDDRQWSRNFRMKKATFLKLCHELRPYLEKESTNWKEPISVEKRVAVAIWRMATPCEYRTISLLFGIGRSTACKRKNSVGPLVCLRPRYP